MKYQVKMIGGVGQHDCGLGEDGQPIMCSPGQTVVVDKPVHDIFPDKFSLLAEIPDAPASPEAAAAAPAKPAGKKASKPKGSSEVVPVNVTDKFPSAGTAGLIIMQTGTTFSILRGEEVLAADLANETLVVTEIDEIAEAAAEVK